MGIPSVPPPESDVVRVLNDFRKLTDDRDTEAMRTLADQWFLVENNLENDMFRLAHQMAENRLAGKVITEQMVFLDQRYKILYDNMTAQIDKYATGAVDLIAGSASNMALLGVDAANAAIFSSYGPLGGFWNRLNIRAVEAMVATTGAKGPLRLLLRETFPLSTNGLIKALINGMARGEGAAATAKKMAEGFGMGLERSLLIARTENARAYRFGSVEQYRESGVVRVFMRLVKKVTACMACLIEDGEVIRLENELTDHPRGKCSAIPWVEGTDPPAWEKGKEWFKRQPEAEQRRRMGNAKYEAWKDDKISLEDLVREHKSKVWGNSPRVTTLKELGLGIKSKKKSEATVDIYVKGKNLTEDGGAVLDFNKRWHDYTGRRDYVPDARLAAIGDMQGFSGLPTKLTQAQYADKLAKGEAKQMFRGTADSGGKGSGARYAEQFRTGDMFYGLGIYGNGVYFAVDPMIAVAYSRESQMTDKIITAALRSDAKIIDYKDIVSVAEATGMDKFFDDPGQIAAWLGYDAIYKEGTNYYVILNRTAMFYPGDD